MRFFVINDGKTIKVQPKVINGPESFSFFIEASYKHISEKVTMRSILCTLNIELYESTKNFEFAELLLQKDTDAADSERVEGEGESIIQPSESLSAKIISVNSFGLMRVGLN